MSFGVLQPKSLVGWIGFDSFTKILYLAVTFFNLWQFVISFLYLVYNAVLTAMLVANEWNEFEETRKTLRVTAPQNIQRSSYFVSVSLKYGLPIVIIFGVLHFTVSQSVFVMYLTRFLFDRTKDVSNRSVTSGYSCIAIIASFVLGSVLVLVLILIGLLGKYRSGISLVSICSAAISAACHRPSRDNETHIFQVQWGVVSEDARSGIGSGRRSGIARSQRREMLRGGIAGQKLESCMCKWNEIHFRNIEAQMQWDVVVSEDEVSGVGHLLDYDDGGMLRGEKTGPKAGSFYK
ncbi:MAG: hypothetical protein HETSPECPRED_003674 [Heterodermia speciosa]|uniref:Uncharacterized protein n=1 Tax=Heterodermia speciosa TaxID=116794 RepID=A0A8H3ILK8_9LECA|nr:MAG: hypothetical protein HETSPECPRED_003674 [Heterodermia speciosa]